MRRGIDSIAAQGIICGHGNILFLDFGGDYMIVCVYQCS